MQGGLFGGLSNNYLEIAANGDVSFNGTAGFYPVRIAQADIPTPDTGELIIWEDTDDNTIYLVYNDTVSGVLSVQLT